MKGTTTGVWMNGTMTGVVLNGMKDYERMCCTSASSFPLGSSERVNENVDTGATVDTFPVNFDREGVGDGSSYDWISDVEARQFQGFDEKCKPRSLNERLTYAHRVLGSTAPAYAPAPASAAVEIACKEQQDLYEGHDGGYMSLVHSQIGQGMRIHFGNLLKEYGMSDLIPIYLEKAARNFSLNGDVKSEEIHSVNEAEQCLEKENCQSENEYGRAHRS